MKGQETLSFVLVYIDFYYANFSWFILPWSLQWDGNGEKRDYKQQNQKWSQETHGSLDWKACSADAKSRKVLNTHESGANEHIWIYQQYVPRETQERVDKIVCCYTHVFALKLSKISFWNCTFCIILYLNIFNPDKIRRLNDSSKGPFLVFSILRIFT